MYVSYLYGYKINNHLKLSARGSISQATTNSQQPCNIDLPNLTFFAGKLQNDANKKGA